VLRDLNGKLLTVREVAEALSVSTATVYSLCDRDELAHVRILNAIRVRREDLEAFIAAKRKRPAG
jgi:excisionase family DNA binding protein